MIQSTFFLHILKFIGGLVFFVLTIEMCARIDDLLKYDAPIWNDYTSERLKSTNSEGFFYNIPNARFQKWQNNGDGFRGPDIALSKTPGTIRIICLGASESYGLYESPGKEWPAQLRTLLSNTKYEVINVSVVGLGLESYEGYFKKYVQKFDADIVICLVNPMLYASVFEKKLKKQTSGFILEGKANTKKTVSFTGVISSNCRCLPKLKQAFKQALQSNFPNILKRYQILNLQKQITASELKHLGKRKPADNISTASVRGFSNDLSKLTSFLESQHIKVFLGTYPALISRDNLATYPDIFLDNRRFFIDFSFQGMIDTLEQYNTAIKMVANEHKTMLADCQAVIPKTEHYFGDNVHYSDHGARLVAEEMAKQILSDSAVGVKPPDLILKSQ